MPYQLTMDDLPQLVGRGALILRGNGQLTGCSTPLGRRGIFWEIANEELRKYPRQGNGALLEKLDALIAEYTH